MGRSDPYVYDFYKDYIKPQGSVALLGFTDNDFFDGDLYDLQLNNWNINDNWELKKKYDTVICTRTAYFAKNPKDFIKRCYNSLNSGGKLYVDWGLGDHWRFENYKIGWVKDGEHEHAYEDDNYLWSGVWDDSFLEDEEYKLFESRVKQRGYFNVKETVFQEVPEILELNVIKKYFDLSYNMLALWDGGISDSGDNVFYEDKHQIVFKHVATRQKIPPPQLYILLSCRKRKET